MNRIKLAGPFVVLFAAAAIARSQEPPQMPKPTKEHDWLKQLAGEWDSESEVNMGPGQPPMKTKGMESSRMIGGFFLVAENTGSVMGTPFTGILTLGYDPEKKHYVGTWIDSYLGYLWTYTGEVDEAEKTLTLHTEGPSHEEPGKMAKFKEVITVKSADEKTFESHIQGADGNWTRVMSVTYRRKK